MCVMKHIHIPFIFNKMTTDICDIFIYEQAFMIQIENGSLFAGPSYLNSSLQSKLKKQFVTQ